MNLGEKIRFLRLKHRLSQESLAQALKTTKQAIYKYENGIVTNIPLDKIEALANVLCTTPAYLMGWDDNNEDEGIATKTTPDEPKLTEGEMKILNAYNRLSDDGKKIMQGIVESLDKVPADKEQLLLGLIRAGLGNQK